MLDCLSGEVVVVTDSSLRIRFVSDVREPRCASQSAAGDLTGLDLFQCFNDVPEDEALEVCRSILSGRALPSGSKCYRKSVRRPGVPGERWTVIMAPHEGAPGQVDGVVYARIRSDDGASDQAQAPEPEMLYEALIEGASEVVFVLDTKAVVTFVTRRAETVSGFPPSHFVGKHFKQIVHPDDVKKCSAKLGEVLATRAPFTDFEFRVVMPDESVRHVVANGNVVATAEGDVVVGICRDVTESVELREELMARNAALAALNEIVVALSRTELLDDTLQATLEKILRTLGLKMGGILLASPDGGMRMRAQAGLDTGWFAPRQQMLSDLLAPYCQSLTEPVLLPDIRESGGGLENLEDLIPDSEVRGALFVPLMWDGAVNAALVVAVPAPGVLTAGQMEFVSLAAGMLGQALESAELREAERIRSLQLAALAKEAQHRIRNNLQMIAGLLSMAEAERGEGRAVERSLRQIRAIAAVHDLLDPDRAAEKLSARDCVRQIASSALAATGRGESVELLVQGDDAELPADAAVALGIIVNELVNNAVVHGFPNRRSGRILVEIEKQDSATLVSVTDNGVGLPAGFVTPSARDATSGLALVGALASHGLGGRLEIGPAHDAGTCASISF